MNTSELSVFISYSRESEEHTVWVRRLADSLEAMPEFHVIFDDYDMHAGKDLTHFMDAGAASDRIVVVVTPEYVKKANERLGGVGYESSVISAHLLENNLADRFVPVIRRGTDRPSFLSSKAYVDFRNDQSFENSLGELKRALLRLAPAKRPAKKAHDFGSPVQVPAIEMPKAARDELDPHRPVVVINFDVDGNEDASALPMLENIGQRVAVNVKLEDIHVAGNKGRGTFGEIGILRPGEKRAVTFRAEGEGPFWQSYLIRYLETELENRPPVDWSRESLDLFKPSEFSLFVTYSDQSSRRRYRSEHTLTLSLRREVKVRFVRDEEM